MAHLWRLASALRPGGRIVTIDCLTRDAGGSPVAHRVAREDLWPAT
ncbi:MAG: hypothetical protein IPQ24_04885 [Anaeromyxobacter sp.]|nr:hypothetical protein [Anaeromyxobacter sp.]